MNFDNRIDVFTYYCSATLGYEALQEFEELIQNGYSEEEAFHYAMEDYAVAYPLACGYPYSGSSTSSRSDWRKLNELFPDLNESKEWVDRNWRFEDFSPHPVVSFSN